MPIPILVVDDEADTKPLINQKFRRQIKKGDYVFHYALNGEEALAKLKEIPEIVIVISDINMPTMDGLTMLGRMHELGRPVWTAIVSAYDDTDRIDAAKNLGAKGFLGKPIEFTEYDAMIERAMAEMYPG